MFEFDETPLPSGIWPLELTMPELPREELEARVLRYIDDEPAYGWLGSEEACIEHVKEFVPGLLDIHGEEGLRDFLRRSIPKETTRFPNAWTGKMPAFLWASLNPSMHLMFFLELGQKRILFNMGGKKALMIDGEPLLHIDLALRFNPAATFWTDEKLSNVGFLSLVKLLSTTMTARWTRPYVLSRFGAFQQALLDFWREFGDDDLKTASRRLQKAMATGDHDKFVGSLKRNKGLLRELNKYLSPDFINLWHQKWGDADKFFMGHMERLILKSSGFTLLDLAILWRLAKKIEAALELPPDPNDPFARFFEVP